MDGGRSRRIAATVPFADPQRVVPAAAIHAAIREVIEDGRFVGGPAVALFERDFARYCGAAHCVGVSSGTSALQAALLACDIGPGDEVITVSATFVATAAAVVATGAVPVFVDIDPVRRTLRPELIRAAITPRTKAIVPVDYYGQPADHAPIRELADRHGLVVVADAAQAHGAGYRGRRVGSLANATCFSFYPAKNLGAVGDGGAVTTDDPEIAQRIRELRDHGRGADRDEHVRIGHNWRLDSIQAAVLRVKLPLLDHWNTSRRKAADRYARLLAGTGLDLPVAVSDVDHVFHLYVVRHPRRDEVRAALGQRGIDTRVHYPRPVHLIPSLARYGSTWLPETEALAAQCLSLPLFPGITETEQNRVAAAVREVTSHNRRKGA